MALKAIINNKTIISTFLSDCEWKKLKEKIKHKKWDVIIFQSKKLGYLRVSKNGIKHFVHNKNQKPDNWKPESEEHLLIKNEIVKIVRELGWNVEPEFIGDGWGADIFLKKGDVKKVFEIQWSPQTYQKTIERHNKYKNSKIQDIWFFKKIPKELLLQSNIIPKYNYKAEKELPIFNIKIFNNNEIVIVLYGKEIKIKDFIKMFLEGDVVYKDKMDISIKYEIYEASCRNHHPQYLFRINSEYLHNGSCIGNKNLKVKNSIFGWSTDELSIVKLIKDYLVNNNYSNNNQLNSINKRYWVCNNCKEQLSANIFKNNKKVSLKKINAPHWCIKNHN